MCVYNNVYHIDVTHKVVMCREHQAVTDQDDVPHNQMYYKHRKRHKVTLDIYEILITHSEKYC